MKIDYTILVQVVSVVVLTFLIFRKAMALIPMNIGFMIKKTSAM